MTAATPQGAMRIEVAIREVRAAGRAALAPFLTAGLPSLDTFAGLLDAVGREAAVVEIGVPFSDPMADGVTIQSASRRALRAGVTIPWILEVLRQRRRRAPIVLMSYLNPLLAYGIERLARDAAAAGVAGLIVPDLPYEEGLPLQRAFDEAGLAWIQLVTPVTSAQRLQILASRSRGFVYAVTMTGTTGGSAASDGAVLDYLDRVRAAARVPVLAGFGLRTAEQVRRIARHADGVILGSVLIEILERGGDVLAFLGAMGPEPGPVLERTS